MEGVRRKGEREGGWKGERERGREGGREGGWVERREGEGKGGREGGREKERERDEGSGGVRMQGTSSTCVYTCTCREENGERLAKPFNGFFLLWCVVL